MRGKRSVWRMIAGGMLGGAGMYMLLNCRCEKSSMKKLKRRIKSRAAGTVGIAINEVGRLLTCLGNTLADSMR